MNGWIRQQFKDDLIKAATHIAWGATVLLFFAASAAADEAQWIWSPDHTKESVPTGEACHFRKSFTVRVPEGGQIAIAADDQYEIYLNGRRIGTGEATKKLDEYDISRYLTRGNNVIAVEIHQGSSSSSDMCCTCLLMTSWLQRFCASVAPGEFEISAAWRMGARGLRSS